MLDNIARSGHKRLARSFNLCYQYIDDFSSNRVNVNLDGILSNFPELREQQPKKFSFYYN